MKDMMENVDILALEMGCGKASKDANAVIAHNSGGGAFSSSFVNGPDFSQVVAIGKPCRGGVFVFR